MYGKEGCAIAKRDGETKNAGDTKDAGDRPAPRAPRTGGGGPWRWLPAGSTSASRLPFVLVVVGLLVAGLVALLMLNTALNQGSFKLSELQRKSRARSEQAQQLRQQIEHWSAPGALADRAREMGMVPGGNPAFLRPNGTVRGKPEQATAPPEPSTSEPSTPGPSGAGRASEPGASPTGRPGPAPSASDSAEPSATPSPSATSAAADHSVTVLSRRRG